MVEIALEKAGIYTMHRNKSVNIRISIIEALLSGWSQELLDIPAIGSDHITGEISGVNTVGEIASVIFFNAVMEIDCSNMSSSSKEKMYLFLSSKKPQKFDEARDFLEDIMDNKFSLYTPKEWQSYFEEE